MNQIKLFAIFICIASLPLIAKTEDQFGTLLYYDNGKISSWDRPISLSFHAMDDAKPSADIISRGYATIRFYADASGYDFQSETQSLEGTASPDSNFIVLFGDQIADTHFSEKQITDLKATYSDNALIQQAMDEGLTKLNSGDQLKCGGAIIGDPRNSAGVSENIQGALIYINSDQDAKEQQLCMDKFIPAAFGVMPIHYEIYEADEMTSTTMNYGTIPIFLTTGKICREKGENNFLCVEEANQGYLDMLEDFLE